MSAAPSEPMIARLIEWALALNDGVIGAAIFFAVVAGMLAWSFLPLPARQAR